jgi:hypothetical protein
VTTQYGYTTDDRLAVGAGHAFGYDPLDRLSLLGASGTRLRYGAAGELVGEQSSSGTWLKRYVHGDAADEPLVRYEGAGVGDRRWFHADERGSVIAVTGGAGNTMARLSYDEHGVPAAYMAAYGSDFQFSAKWKQL